MATPHSLRAPPLLADRPLSVAGIPAQGITDFRDDLSPTSPHSSSAMEKLSDSLKLFTLENRSADGSGADSSGTDSTPAAASPVSPTDTRLNHSTSSLTRIVEHSREASRDLTLGAKHPSESEAPLPKEAAKEPTKDPLSLAKGLLDKMVPRSESSKEPSAESEESADSDPPAPSDTKSAEDSSLHTRLVDNPATYIGPNDFNEKNFHESVSFYDYATLGAILGTLPSVVVVDMMWRSCKKLYMPRQVSLRDAAFDSAANHVASLCNWPQLRRLCPVRPLREELQLARFKNLPHYNHYFGGAEYSARWLVEHPDRQRGDPVMLYLHGGSYALKVQRPQLKYLVALQKALQPAKLSILVLDYTIGPFAKFPTQLNEGMACYADLRRSCDNIMFFGDSAGGHLALSMLLSGASCESLVLVSPSTDMTSGLRDDIMMREAFVDTEKYRYSDPIISPLFADPRIWTHKIPADSAIVWGGAEPCKLQMHDFAVVAKIPHVFEEPGGSHDCILRGTQNPGSQFIQRFLASALRPNREADGSATASPLSPTSSAPRGRAMSVPPARGGVFDRRPSLRRSLSQKILRARESSPRAREFSSRTNSDPHIGHHSDTAPPLPSWPTSAVHHSASRDSPVPSPHKNLNLVTGKHTAPASKLPLSPVSPRALSASPPRSSPAAGLSSRARSHTPLA